MTASPADDGTASRPAVPFISRVRLKNYKSIAECDVRLGPLTILVGPNGSGKSNFLDALAFLSRAIATTPAEAVESRGGLSEILRRVPEQAGSLTVAIAASVPMLQGGPFAHLRADVSYELEIGPPFRRGPRPFEIVREACELRWNGQVSSFRVERGHAEVKSAHRPADIVDIEADRLYASAASVQPPYATFFAFLGRMPFYNFDLQALRKPLPESAGMSLGLHGEHLGAVFAALAADNRGCKARVDAYMRAIVPDTVAVEPYSAGGYMTIALRTASGVGGEEVDFGPESMSDGTIRAAAVLAALFEPAVLDGRVRLIGIEEPEIALHPAAAGILFDALSEASEHVQVLATSQSADLLDREDLDMSAIRPVTMRDGLTIIGEVDEASREIVKKKLYTLGELMRGNQLMPGEA